MAKKKNKKIGIIESHFLDSGAFTLWTKAARYAEEQKCGRWDYYETSEFWEYMDSYAAFVKEYAVAIDLYANVDVIPNPQLTWRNQKYLENKHKLSPVPVVHYTTDTKWLKRYMKAGYKIIGLGGLVGSTMKKDCQNWLDECFNIVCDNPDRLPKVKLHGFGVTSYKFLIRYPWWSVDSAAWAKIASFGGICVPQKRKGKFVFNEAPYAMKISMESPQAETRNHFLRLNPERKEMVREWLAFIKIPVGSFDEKTNEVQEVGAVTSHIYRRIANLIFYDMMVKALPEWPWPFGVRKKRSLGLRV